MTAVSEPRQALSGVTVLDLATYLAAPVCATLLGEFGADVIKVAQPRAGLTGHADGSRLPGGRVRRRRRARGVASRGAHRRRADRRPRAVRAGAPRAR